MKCCPAISCLSSLFEKRKIKYKNRLALADVVVRLCIKVVEHSLGASQSIAQSLL
jgi:hypothetical protein